MSRKQRLRGSGWALLLICILAAISFVSPGAASATPTTTALPDCPQGIKCVVYPAAYADGTCNYTPGHRPEAQQVLGITEHTTEGTLQDALLESQDINNCVSWNYLVAQDGTVYVSVPPKDIAYDAGNWYFNSHYVQVEQIGYAEDCSTLTGAEYAASIALDRYLIQRYRIHPSASTILGHDSVPGTGDSTVAGMHWDPGVCWPWSDFLARLGAPIVTSAGPNAKVVTINPPLQSNHQPVQDCPGLNFTNCTPAAQPRTNFVTLYTAPSTTAPLLSDPYLHSDGSAGSTAMQDWGDKAEDGHSYYVVGRKPGWLQIDYAGGTAWLQNDGRTTVGTHSLVVSAKGSAPVAVYGRPLPEASAPGVLYGGAKPIALINGWCAAGQTPIAGTALDCIPTDLQPSLTGNVLSKYSLPPGQFYVLAQVTAPDSYTEGCDVTACTYAGDNVVVVGKTQFLEIEYNHRFAFVKASDVRVSLA